MPAKDGLATLILIDEALMYARESDELDKEIAQELYAVFRREREEWVEPVEKQDVAEILRRRFFTAQSIRDRERFRPHVVAVLDGISNLDDEARKKRQAEEERYLDSYPFHPELTDVLLHQVGRTRGLSTDPRRPANLRDCSERGREMGHVSPRESGCLHLGSRRRWPPGHRSRVSFHSLIRGI